MLEFCIKTAESFYRLLSGKREKSYSNCNSISIVVITVVIMLLLLLSLLLASVVPLPKKLIKINDQGFV